MAFEANGLITAHQKSQFKIGIINHLLSVTWKYFEEKTV